MSVINLESSVGNVTNKLCLLHGQKIELQFSGTKFLLIKVPVLVFCGFVNDAVCMWAAFGGSFSGVVST